MKIKSLIGTCFVFYLILMIGFNEPAYALIVWTAQTSGTTFNLNDVSAVDANTAWVIGNSGTVLYTTDGGTTWTPQTPGTSSLADVSAVDANTAWAVGVTGEIRYTTNAGTTWTGQTSGTTDNLRDVSAVDANTAWAVGDSGTILYTTNAGTTWTAQTTPTTNILYGVSAVDANTAWVSGAGGTILYTTDAGTTWTAQTSGTTNILFDVAAVDANTAWAVGQSGTILKSFDSTSVIAQATITGGCEVDLSSTSIIFLSGNPIDNGAGVGTGEVTATLQNTLGNLNSDTSAFVGDWTDGASTPTIIMDGTHTKVSSSTGDFASKTALSKNSLTPTPIGIVPASSSLTTFWDLEIVLDGADPAYTGPTQQIITFDFACV